MNGNSAPSIISELVRTKTPHFGKVDSIWTWDEALRFLDTHPSDLLDHHTDKMRFFLKGANKRPSAPLFSKEIIKMMESIFHKNPISNIMFYGFSSDCQSYPWHADKMDVFLVQVLGDIQIRVEKTECENEARTFDVGDCVYIPRGTHHQIITGKSRVTFSFGVEKQPDPSTYV
jgi:mannose-6-phosphate isomerase-like protein (cupin superfamily)